MIALQPQEAWLSTGTDLIVALLKQSEVAMSLFVAVADQDYPGGTAE
jgi:hypothetical protein